MRKHSSWSQHISVLNTCILMIRQVCTTEHSFIKTTSGMHRRPFESRHLVIISFESNLPPWKYSMKIVSLHNSIYFFGFD